MHFLKNGVSLGERIIGSTEIWDIWYILKIMASTYDPEFFNNGIHHDPEL